MRTMLKEQSQGGTLSHDAGCVAAMLGRDIE
jgi:hypothetical protein